MQILHTFKKELKITVPGKRIKHHREGLGLSQAQMAEKLHITQSTYSRIEQMDENITIGQLKQITAILNVSLNDLLPDDLVIANKIP